MTDRTPLTAHAGSRSWELRFGDEVMARVSTTFTMQAEFAQQVTLRYNAHEGLLAALKELMQGVEADAKVEGYDPRNVVDAHTWLAMAMQKADAAIAKAEGRKP